MCCKHSHSNFILPTQMIAQEKPYNKINKRLQNLKKVKDLKWELKKS
jgi:tetrahydromethanopterin S-methyltransferase subunit G